jgi:cellulose biosynthesis protein BcsQ
MIVGYDGPILKIETIYILGESEMAKRLVLFNHKGGVSKTTTVYNWGWMLAEQGHQVLLVDADPQCNLSSLILGDDFDAYYLDEATRLQNIKEWRFASL